MESCPAIITGERFLTRVLAHIDCQAQVLGSYGYQSLAQPGALASALMTGLLTIFIALYGIRLMFGPGPGVRDVVFDVIKVGLVLTLAFSWPAYRTVVYDVVINGPGEIAASMGAPGSAQGNEMLVDRLQKVDNRLVQLTDTGTGRVGGQLFEGQTQGSGFMGGSLQDERAMGWTRVMFLTGTIGSLALLRIAGGLLLALAPLAAGLLLFDQARGLFSGWLKGLVLVLLGSIGASVVLGAELALVEPWLGDALRVRAAGYATPSAPVEIFSLILAFALVQFAMIWLLAKVAFYRGWARIPAFPDIPALSSTAWRPAPALAGGGETPSGSRAQRISDSVESVMRREERRTSERLDIRSVNRSETRENRGPAGYSASPDPQGRLGSSYRRTTSRSSGSAKQRDDRR